MKIEMFNLSYIIYAVLFFLLLVFCLLLLKDKSDSYKKRFISGLLFFALIVHFLKLAFEPYINDPTAIRKITPENICALSTLVFPFVFLSKSKVLKDYMFYIGVLSGTLAIFFPVEAFGKDAFIFDTVRFYIAHIIITVAPFLMVATGLHKLDYHRIYKVPIMFILVMTIILVNEIILEEIGLVPLRGEDLLFDGHRNFSMVFGVSDSLPGVSGLLDFFTPKFMMRIPYGEFSGQKKYWPILWAIIPSFVLIGGLSFLLSIWFEKKHMLQDMNSIKDWLNRNIFISKKK